MPGVQSAAITSSLPLDGLNDTSCAVTVEGQPPLNSNVDQDAGFRMVSPGYFSTMGIPLMRGRDFNGQDTQDSPQVVIINQSLVRAYFNDSDPLGKRINLTMDKPDVLRTVVGVIADFKYEGLEVPTTPEAYIPHTQQPWGFMGLAVRTSTNANTIIGPVENSIWGLERNAALSRVKTMKEILSAQTAWSRFYLILLGVFALVALALATVGIYGVMSYTVLQSTREIGIRMALGAQSRNTLGRVLGRGMLLVGAGLVAGIAGAFAITRVMKALLFGVEATDPMTFIVVSLVLAAAALLSCYLPARRAARVDPIVALRFD
ncbi:MAG TPA: FtsX-like permease family protein [Blastocatellia bacterium]